MPSGEKVIPPKVEGVSGRRAPRSGAAGPDNATALGYVCIPARIGVYSHGFSQKPMTQPKGFCPASGLPIYGTSPRSRGSVGAKRGKIRSMTHAAARRMREDILTKTVVDAKLYDVSITAPGKGHEWTQDEYVRRERMYVKRLVRAGFGGWIRREMQRRGQPHGHLMIYVPNSIPESVRNETIYMAWWYCLTEEEKKAPGAWKRHCVVKGPFEEASECPEWMEYMCAHSTKRKAAQNCYEGKQWSRFGSDVLEARAMVGETELQPHETKAFTRLLGRYIHSHLRSKRNSMIRRGKKYRRRVRRPSMSINARRIRFMPGKVVMRMLQWAKS